MFAHTTPELAFHFTTRTDWATGLDFPHGNFCAIDTHFIIHVLGVINKYMTQGVRTLRTHYLIELQSSSLKPVTTLTKTTKWMCVCVCMYVCMCIYERTCIYTTYLGMHAWMCVCVCVCTYVCLHMVVSSRWSIRGRMIEHWNLLLPQTQTTHCYVVHDVFRNDSDTRVIAV
jgi:hypothetical protein